MSIVEVAGSAFKDIWDDVLSSQRKEGTEGPLREGAFETPLELVLNHSILWLCSSTCWFPSTLLENAKPLAEHSQTQFS